ncbi:AbrB family transcriptional regulator [Ferrovibrio xuzhouensis]|uniref:AbrB family transcriptional regulator n=1 Tax=Ferrovibrio xuzhouensis TaxID=1576914 RepID=A0ABV7VM00_9PROT
MAGPLLRQAAGNLPALLIGTLGGFIFFLLHMPLAWMLGSMVFVAAFALMSDSGGQTGRILRHSLPVKIEGRLRELMVTVIGVLLGSAFRPAMLDRLVEWAGLVALLLAYIPFVTLLGYLLFRKVGKFDPVTSFFSATPGGLQEMTVIGEHYGGDARHIVLTHAIRIFVAVMTIPVYFRYIAGYHVPSMAPGLHVTQMPLHELALLAGCGVVGWIGAHFLRMPASRLIGPMVVSAAVHLAGFSEAKPPPEIVAIAQVVMGAALGTRFAGTPLIEIRRIAGLSVVSALIMVGCTVACTFAFAGLIGTRFETLALTLSPGGLAEMSLIALALGVDVAIISTMHVLRIAIVVLLAPLTFRLLGLRPKGG